MYEIILIAFISLYYKRKPALKLILVRFEPSKYQHKNKFKMSAEKLLNEAANPHFTSQTF